MINIDQGGLDMTYRESFGITTLELAKEDIKNHPERPVLRLIDDGDLLGIFDVRTSEVIQNNDLAYYDIDFVKKELERNRDNFLETWNDYVRMYYA